MGLWWGEQSLSVEDWTEWLLWWPLRRKKQCMLGTEF